MMADAKDVYVQEQFLGRTNNQSLNLSAAEFLEVLKEIADMINEEPALSTYWDMRDQLEQVVKQERKG